MQLANSARSLSVGSVVSARWRSTVRWYSTADGCIFPAASVESCVIESSLSAAQAGGRIVRTLSERLRRARDDDLPVRMVVRSPEREKSGRAGSDYVRPDLIGKVAEFDGDRFAVDFTRPHAEIPTISGGRRKWLRSVCC